MKKYLFFLLFLMIILGECAGAQQGAKNSKFVFFEEISGVFGSKIKYSELFEAIGEAISDPSARGKMTEALRENLGGDETCINVFKSD